jgi:hypothetical protein
VVVENDGQFHNDNAHHPPAPPPTLGQLDNIVGQIRRFGRESGYAGSPGQGLMQIMDPTFRSGIGEPQEYPPITFHDVVNTTARYARYLADHISPFDPALPSSGFLAALRREAGVEFVWGGDSATHAAAQPRDRAAAMAADLRSSWDEYTAPANRSVDGDVHYWYPDDTYRPDDESWSDPSSVRITDGNRADLDWFNRRR